LLIFSVHFSWPTNIFPHWQAPGTFSQNVRASSIAVLTNMHFVSQLTRTRRRHRGRHSITGAGYWRISAKRRGLYDHHA
jgi:hypothetical protein